MKHAFKMGLISLIAKYLKELNYYELLFGLADKSFVKKSLQRFYTVCVAAYSILFIKEKNTERQIVNNRSLALTAWFRCIAAKLNGLF